MLSLNVSCRQVASYICNHFVKPGMTGGLALAGREVTKLLASSACGVKEASSYLGGALGTAVGHTGYHFLEYCASKCAGKAPENASERITEKRGACGTLSSRKVVRYVGKHGVQPLLISLGQLAGEEIAQALGAKSCDPDSYLIYAGSVMGTLGGHALYQLLAFLASRCTQEAETATPTDGGEGNSAGVELGDLSGKDPRSSGSESDPMNV